MLSEDFIKKKWIDILQKPKGGNKLFNLYIDSPFCLKFCDFCMYSPTIITSSSVNKKKDDYYDSLLIQQIERFKDVLLYGNKFDTVYFGGGTSALMSEEQMTNIFSSFQAYFDFKNGPIEKTFELNPISITKKKLDILRSWNFTNVTMGIQSFDKDVLKYNNRVNLSIPKMRELMSYIHNNNIKTNIDIMVFIFQDDLKQDLQILMKDLEVALKIIQPDRITIYPNSFKLLQTEDLINKEISKIKLQKTLYKISLLRKLLSKFSCEGYYKDIPPQKVTVKNYRTSHFFMKTGNTTPFLYNCTYPSKKAMDFIKNQYVLSFGGYENRKPYSYLGDEFGYENHIVDNSILYSQLF